MKTSMENLGELLREIKVELPIDIFHTEVDKKIKKLAKEAHINGFRKGKVPTGIIKNRFGKNIRYETANTIIGDFLPKIFVKENAHPVATPDIVSLDFSQNDVFRFKVRFEINPEIILKPLSELEFDYLSCEITPENINKALGSLQQKHIKYSATDRISKLGDKINLDFFGSIEGQAFKGGEAKNYELLLGSKQMVPDFEEGLIGKKLGDTFTLNITFPEHYPARHLAKKTVQFKVHINQVLMPGNLPELTDEFAQKLGSKNLAELTVNIKQHMIEEANTRLNSKNKEVVFSKLIKANPITLPKTSIEAETKRLANHQNLKTDAIHNKDIGENMQAEVKKRVHLGLLLAKIIVDYKLKVSDEQIKEKIRAISSAYGKQADTMFDELYQNQEKRSDISALLLEEEIITYIVKYAKVNHIKMPFNDVVKA